MHASRCANYASAKHIRLHCDICLLAKLLLMFSFVTKKISRCFVRESEDVIEVFKLIYDKSLFPNFAFI